MGGDPGPGDLTNILPLLMPVLVSQVLGRNQSREGLPGI